jgi:hypothetical protein
MLVIALLVVLIIASIATAISPSLLSVFSPIINPTVHLFSPMIAVLAKAIYPPPAASHHQEQQPKYDGDQKESAFNVWHTTTVAQEF